MFYKSKIDLEMLQCCVYVWMHDRKACEHIYSIYGERCHRSGLLCCKADTEWEGRYSAHTVRVVCSFLGNADNPRPNLPAVFGHGLLLCLQSLMSSTLFKVHKLDFNSFPQCCMQSVSSVSFHSHTFSAVVYRSVYTYDLDKIWIINVCGALLYDLEYPQ